METTKQGDAISASSETDRLPPGWLAPATAVVFAGWALYLALSVIDLASSEEPFFSFWLPTAAIGVFTILLLGVVPHSYLAWRFRRKGSAVAALVSIASIATIVGSWFFAHARWAALWSR